MDPFEISYDGHDAQPAIRVHFMYCIFSSANLVLDMRQEC
jgi:hypothetical protein